MDSHHIVGCVAREHFWVEKKKIAEAPHTLKNKQLNKFEWNRKWSLCVNSHDLFCCESITRPDECACYLCTILLFHSIQFKRMFFYFLFSLQKKRKEMYLFDSSNALSLLYFFISIFVFSYEIGIRLRIFFSPVQPIT